MRRGGAAAARAARGAACGCRVVGEPVRRPRARAADAPAAPARRRTCRRTRRRPAARGRAARTSSTGKQPSWARPSRRTRAASSSCRFTSRPTTPSSRPRSTSTPRRVARARRGAVPGARRPPGAETLRWRESRPAAPRGARMRARVARGRAAGGGAGRAARLRRRGGAARGRHDGSRLEQFRRGLAGAPRGGGARGRRAPRAYSHAGGAAARRRARPRARRGGSGCPLSLHCRSNWQPPLRALRRGQLTRTRAPAARRCLLARALPRRRRGRRAAALGTFGGKPSRLRRTAPAPRTRPLTRRRARCAHRPRRAPGLPPEY